MGDSGETRRERVSPEMAASPPTPSANVSVAKVHGRGRLTMRRSAYRASSIHCSMSLVGAWNGGKGCRGIVGGPNLRDRRARRQRAA